MATERGGVHEFEGVLEGTPDRPCTKCGKADRHPIHNIKGGCVAVDKHIGFVDILRDRFYDNTEHGEVLVPAGRYRLLETVDGALAFELRGYPAIGSYRPERIGDGIFLMDPNDRPKSGKPVEFVRRIRGDREEFLRSSECEEGNPAQRFRIQMEIRNG